MQFITYCCCSKLSDGNIGNLTSVLVTLSVTVGEASESTLYLLKGDEGRAGNGKKHLSPFDAT